MLRGAFLLASLCSAHAATFGFERGGGDGKLCAGIIDPCDSLETCTTVALGPCDTDKSDTKTTPKASSFLSSTYVGMAFVVEKDYLTNAKSLKSIEPDTGKSENGYRDAEAKTGYAYTMTGARYGDLSDAGAYVGIASYLVTGDTALEESQIGVRIADADNWQRKKGGDGKGIGAPLGPYDVCIVKPTNGKCETKRTFKPGEYKFSIFGATFGTNYPPKKGENGFPQYTHIGIRMKLKVNGFSADDLKLNGDKTLATIGNTDVTKIAIVSGNTTLQLEFPLDYNVGSTTGGDTDAVGIPDATKTVKIKVHDAKITGEDSVYIDYLFDETDINKKDRYFLYDPDVNVVDTKTATPASPKPPAGGGTPAAKPAAKPTPPPPPGLSSTRGASGLLAAALAAALALAM